MSAEDQGARRDDGLHRLSLQDVRVLQRIVEELTRAISMTEPPDLAEVQELLMDARRAAKAYLGYSPSTRL